LLIVIFIPGLVEHLITVMQDAFTLCWSDAGEASQTQGAQESEQAMGVLQASLDLMNTLLKQVSDVVRRALQVV
jgi:hypothetical protein